MSEAAHALAAASAAPLLLLPLLLPAASAAAHHCRWLHPGVSGIDAGALCGCRERGRGGGGALRRLPPPL